MARSGGLEPPTAWFVARYSIQLSYERVFRLVTIWRAREDSNLRPLAPETSALSPELRAH